MEGPRFLQTGEFESLSCLLDTCFSSAPGGVADTWPHVCRAEEQYFDRYLVYVDSGQVISSVGIIPMELFVEGETIPAGGISIVGTHPDYRLQGLAGSLIRSSIELMKERGFAFAWLNGSRQLYERFGWERAGRKYNFHFSERSAAAYPENTMEIRRTSGEEDISEIMDIYNERRHRGVRDRDFTRMLLSRGQTETYVAIENAKVHGYLAVDISRSDPKYAEAYEYGGSGKAFKNLMKYCFDELGLEKVSMASPLFPDSCSSAIYEGASAWDLGFSGWVESGGQMKILDLAATLKGFLPQMMRKRRELAVDNAGELILELGETGEKVILDFGETVAVGSHGSNQALTFGEREMVRLLFGLARKLRPEPIPPLLSSVLPLDFYISPLEMV